MSLIKSRATPSASRSGVKSISRTTTPSELFKVALAPELLGTSFRLYSPSNKSIEPAVITFPFRFQSPFLTATITCCVLAPSRGPTTLGTTCNSKAATDDTSSVNSTSRTLTSSAITSTNLRRPSESAVATISFAKGSRTRRPWTFLNERVVEQTSRTRSIDATSASS